MKSSVICDKLKLYLETIGTSTFTTKLRFDSKGKVTIEIKMRSLIIFYCSRVENWGAVRRGAATAGAAERLSSRTRNPGTAEQHRRPPVSAAPQISSASVSAAGYRTRRVLRSS